MFRGFFYELFGNVIRCFRGQSLFLQLLALPLTYIVVASGFDWSYYEATRSPQLFSTMFPAVLLGFFVPVLLPLILLILGKLIKNFPIQNAGFGLAQAALLGCLLSTSYKVFSGRVPPSVHQVALVDTSSDFHVGFLNEGIFWGWPSSHTTVAFAMAITCILLFPKNKLLLVLSLLYAFYIGFGVSLTIHWCSDFLAGALLGTAIGLVVGKSFFMRSRMNQAAS